MMVRTDSMQASMNGPSDTERTVNDQHVRDMTDSELIEAICAGCRGACSELFFRHKRTVERVLFRCLGSDEEVDDLAQEVFCVAFESIARVQRPEALRSWLIGIAIRKARKRIYSRRRESVVRFVPPSVLFEVSVAEGITASLEAQEALRSVEGVLAAMSREERVVFTLRHIASMDLRSMANAFEVSLATIKRRLARSQQTFALLAGREAVLACWMNAEWPDAIA
jgi:RNA polymerase sigma-70 factor, ECF subfamily